MMFVDQMLNGFIAPGQIMIIFKLLLSAILGFGIGWNRKLNKAGRRTFTLITLGSTIFTIVSVSGFPNNSDVADQARIVAQIVSGVGFLGVGVIWKNEDRLRGLTTAATIWVAAAVGVSVGTEMFTLAVIGTLLTLFILRLKPILKRNKKPLAIQFNSKDI